MLAKGLRKFNKLPINATTLRYFGGNASTSKAASNGLAPVMKHPDGHDDHHHGHVHSAPLDHKFIAEGVDKKLVALNGLQSTKNATVVVDNEFHQLNGLSMFHHEYIFSPYSHANRIVDEPNTHDEPYGYEFGDDPFDTHGHGELPYLMLFVGGIAFTHILAFHFRFDNRKQSEVFYHQRLTAMQIEDEILKMRR